MMELLTGNLPTSESTGNPSVGKDVTEDDSGPSSVSVSDSEKVKIAQVCGFVLYSSYFYGVFLAFSMDIYTLFFSLDGTGLCCIEYNRSRGYLTYL